MSAYSPPDSAPVAPDPFDVNAVLAISAEAVLWSFYTCLFFSCMFLLYSLKTRTKITLLLTTVTITLYALCTAHFALYANQVTAGLWSSGVAGAALATPTTLVADTVAAITCFLGDLTLTYRLWLLYGNSRWKYFMVGAIIVIDIAALVIALFCNVEDILFLTTDVATIDFDTNTRLLVAFNAFIVSINAIITLLIFGRALYVWKQLTWAPSLGPRASRALTVILESGSIFLLSQIIVVVLRQQSSPATTIAVGCAAQIYGIVPTFITTGIAYGLLSESSRDHESTTHIGTLTVPSFGATESTAFTYFQQKVEIYEISPVTFVTNHKTFDSPV